MTTFSQTSIIKITFDGGNGPGYLSVPGVKSGDIIVMACLPNNPLVTNQFYPFINNDDEIYHSSNDDNTGETFTAIIVRAPT